MVQPGGWGMEREGGESPGALWEERERDTVSGLGRGLPLRVATPQGLGGRGGERKWMDGQIDGWTGENEARIGTRRTGQHLAVSPWRRLFGRRATHGGYRRYGKAWPGARRTGVYSPVQSSTYNTLGMYRVTLDERPTLPHFADHDDGIA
nr:hypothetical protein CFP56_12186 [Quercus suber]